MLRDYVGESIVGKGLSEKASLRKWYIISDPKDLAEWRIEKRIFQEVTETEKYYICLRNYKQN